MHRLLTLILLWLFVANTLAAAELKIEVTGIQEDILNVIQENLALYQLKDYPLLNEIQIRSLHQKASKEIKQSLQAFGYYQPEITAELIKEEETWRARYTIDPGPAIHVTKLDIKITGEGASDSEFLDWREDFPLKVGSTLQHKSYETAKQSLLTLAEERGYFDAEMVRHEIEVRLSDDSAEVHLHFDTGPRFQFGRIEFHQTGSVLTKNALTRYIPFSLGEPYLNNKVFELQRALLESGYFETVEIRPIIDDAEQRKIPIEVQLTRRKRTKYDFGIGYGTNTKGRGSVGFERRWINNKGHGLNGEIEISGIGERASMQYRIPLRRAATDYLYISPSWEQEETDTTDTITQSLNFSRVSLQGGKWLQTLSLVYQRERFTVGTERGDTTLIAPGVSWQRTKADNRLQPRKGWSLYFQVRGGAETLGSDTSFLQVRSHIKTVLGIGDRGRVISRLNAGASDVAEFSELPSSHRFFAGGDHSVRGYAFKSLGPTNSLGEVIGGERLLVGSVEYDHGVSNSIDAAVFYDIGNAFDDTDIDAKEGAGVGLRWRLPVGAVRLDLASALSKAGNPWRVHLTIGMDL